MEQVDIGISEADRKALIEGLSRSLADTYTLYLKSQNFHWNVTGPHFHSLHEMFQHEYEALALAIDEIAERIRALGEYSPGSFTEFLKLSAIKEADGVPNANDMVKQLVRDNETVVKTLRSVVAVAEKANDQPTLDLVTQRMHAHEKAAWMFRSATA